jgi:uncharacterized protein (TIGR02757 family)
MMTSPSSAPPKGAEAPAPPRTSASWRRIPTSRRRGILQAIAEVARTCDVAARRAADPVDFVHRYTASADRELVALLASSVAFGQVVTIRATLRAAFERIGPALAVACGDERFLLQRLADLRHRVYRGEDLARLLVGARRVQVEYGSLEACFLESFTRGADLRVALASLTSAIRARGGLGGVGQLRRGPGHLLADPLKGSSCKRLHLFLRWLVRPSDGVDLGLWTGIPPSALLVPVDTHVYKLARNLGFTERSAPDWTVAEEITAVLAELDPRDPVRYDFPLCHLGMVQRCPSRRDPSRCDGCGVRSVCRHWHRVAR